MLSLSRMIEPCWLPAPCRLERRQSSSRMSQESDRDSEKRELRIWMRRKQREQLAVYQKHRESLRQQERRPFSRTTVRGLYLFTFIFAVSFVFFYIVPSFRTEPQGRPVLEQSRSLQDCRTIYTIFHISNFPCMSELVRNFIY